MRNVAVSMPHANPPIGWMNVTGQSVCTPRSKTMTGLSVAQARSTAGVIAAVLFGEMRKMSQLPSSMK